MNINRKSFPIIEQIQNGKLKLSLDAKQFLVFVPCFAFAERIIRSKPIVDYLCTPQIEEVFKCGSTDMINNLESTKGVLLFDEIKKKCCIVYQLLKISNDYSELEFLLVTNNSPELYCKVELTNNFAEIDHLTIQLDESAIEMFVTFVLYFIYFKKNAQIKDKFISRSTRSKYHSSSGLVKTDFKYPINVIDEAFYTNLIVSQGFSVRPHTRKYKKSGKVIHIDSFKKSGYTRKAKKLSAAA